MKKVIATMFAFLGIVAALSAQEQGQDREDILQGIEPEVFYLMPEFGPGYIMYKGQSPLSGEFNICAIDGTVRFKDSEGHEMGADDDGNLERVVISGVTFVADGNGFSRIYPLCENVDLAVKRNVLIMNDQKEGGYGMKTQLSAINEYSSLRAEGRFYRLSSVREYPAKVSYRVSLYKDGKILQLTKKNLQKCFPSKKAEIESWFAQNKKINVEDVDAVTEICKAWAE